MEMDGTGQTQITQTGPTINASGPLTMGFIIYESSKSGNSEIYRADHDGSNEVNLTNNAADDSFPVVSRDGTKIVFLSTRGGALQPHVMDVSGANVVRVSTRQATNPVISPDGSTVLFTSLSNLATQIFKVSASGTGEVNLSNVTVNDDDFACFSPDGTRIVFVRDFKEIYRMNVDGSSKTLLYTHTDDVESPSFSKDGTQLVFMGNNNLQWDIYRLTLAGNVLVNLTNSGADEFKNSGYIGP